MKIAHDTGNVRSMQQRFEQDLAPDRALLLSHPLYAKLNGWPQIRIFMEVHVFAVWDFMTLLKSLQRRLTCVEGPWLPPRDPEAARFVNELVLAEESDVLIGGGHQSHFELYLCAMEEAGARTRAIRSFVTALREGSSVSEALNRAEAPHEAQAFVLHTWSCTQAPVHQSTAAFLYGREDVIPGIFERILASSYGLDDARYAQFSYYLRRHIDLDTNTHAPLARQLLARLCGNETKLWQEAQTAAQSAIRARLTLWDGILARVGV